MSRMSDGFGSADMTVSSLYLFADDVAALAVAPRLRMEPGVVTSSCGSAWIHGLPELVPGYTCPCGKGFDFEEMTMLGDCILPLTFGAFQTWYAKTDRDIMLLTRSRPLTFLWTTAYAPLLEAVHVAAFAACTVTPEQPRHFGTPKE